ncbi:NYN domain-containing protein [Atopobacter phocae]|uniref:NYN domain-containing protein n=1 Tax=Atopobacter phocae TaxID=136492 RepID=UPI00046FE85D|nr:NYN domain-containing protein [Atopobacter phocae]
MKQRLLIVDGYNMIGAWPELLSLKKRDEIGLARDELLRILSDYAAREELIVLVVFDAQLVEGIEQMFDEYNLSVVFTKEGETADSYIERTVKELLSPLITLTVATSDLAEQCVVFQQGALRQSARELYRAIQVSKQNLESESKEIQQQLKRRNSPWHPSQLITLNQLLKDLSEQGQHKK